MQKWTLLAAGLLIIMGLGYGAWQVVELESTELEAVSEWQALVPTQEPTEPGGGGVKFLPHRELGRVQLEQGEDVTFEVCAQDQLSPTRWAGAGLELAVWIPATQTVVVRRPLDNEALEQVERGDDLACLVIARGGELAESGEYVIEAVWPERAFPVELNLIPFQSRVLAHRTPSPVERWPVVIVLLGAILCVIAFARRAPSGDAAKIPSSESSRDLARVVVAVVALVAAGFILALVPIGGSFWGLVRALCLALVQVGAVIFLLRPAARVHENRESKLSALGLLRPVQGLWMLGLAPVVGILLWMLGQVSLRVIPATGESPVGAMVAWPSGSYAIALASVLSPVAEELFFRGFIFGTLARRYRMSIAFTATVVLFALAHLPQSWGAWGGLMAIVLTGVGLTALRLWTGSILAPTLAHLAHNSAITLGWVLIALDR